VRYGRTGLKAVLLAAPGLLPGCSSARYGDEGPAPGVTLPVRFLERDARSVDAGASAAADAEAQPEQPPRTGYLPDPKPLRLARQWEYEVLYDRGQVSVARVTERLYPQPVVTARRMGRFAIELWIGHELIERVRFDFPLVAAEPVHSGSRRPLHEPPSFAEGVVFSRRVLVPASPRATRALLLDRATGRAVVLPWPPDAPLPPARAESSAEPAAPAPTPSPHGDAGAPEAPVGPDAG
jgi:hypothetical protein